MAGCNEENCTCPKKDCERHGNCVECVNYHRKAGNIVFCFRETAAAQAAEAAKK